MLRLDTLLIQSDNRAQVPVSLALQQLLLLLLVTGVSPLQPQRRSIVHPRSTILSSEEPQAVTPAWHACGSSWQQSLARGVHGGPGRGIRSVTTGAVRP